LTVQEIILARNPSVVIDARVSKLILLATIQTGDVFGAQKNDAIALLVLHWLSLENRGTAAAGGAITSEREGDLGRSYGAAITQGDLSQTTWGIQLLSLRKMLIFGPRNRLTTELQDLEA